MFKCRILWVSRWTFTWLTNNRWAYDWSRRHCNRNNSTSTRKNESGTNSRWWSAWLLVYWNIFIWIIWAVSASVIHKNSLISTQIFLLMNLFWANSTTHFRFGFLPRSYNSLILTVFVLIVLRCNQIDIFIGISYKTSLRSLGSCVIICRSSFINTTKILVVRHLFLLLMKLLNEEIVA